MSIAEIEHARACICYDSGSMLLDADDRDLIGQLIDAMDNALLVLRVAGGPAPAVQSALVTVEAAFTLVRLCLRNQELRDLVFHHRLWLVNKEVLRD